MLIRCVLSSDLHEALIAPQQKQFTTHRAVVLHAAWLVQASAH